MEHSDISTYQAYFGRKNGDSYYFNYDILPLIHNFSFTEFLSTAKDTEHGGFLVITNKQYIIGYTAGFGIGTHRATFARVMKEILGGGAITNMQDVRNLANCCIKNLFTARITYDYKGNNKSGLPIYSGSLYFKLPQGDTITKEQFEIFKLFYKDYNQELQVLIRKYGIEKFNIQYGNIDSSGTKVIKTINSLDEFYNYLATRIDNNKILNINNETILGTTSNHKIKKLK